MSCPRTAILKQSLFLAVLLFAGSLYSFCGVVHVDSSNISGPQDGLTWATAYNGLQAGINAAKSGDTVWVAKGTYQPALNGSFSMKQGVKIFGGFLNTHNSFWQRDYTGNQTILEGNGTSVIANYQNGVDNASWLDGFIVTKGKNTQGGGMYNYNVMPTLRNCRFLADTATGPGGGGAIYNYKGYYQQPAQSVIIENCYFKLNTATVTGANASKGGAISNDEVRVLITGCIFDSNAVAGVQTSYGQSMTLYGGAIYSRYSTTTISNSIFNNNYGKGGSQSAYITNVNGGAVALENGQYLIVNSIFSGNAARATSSGTISTGGSNGGAIYFYNGTSSIKGCTFTNNVASENLNFGSGGAVYSLGLDTKFQIDSSNFQGNQAWYGSGIYTWDSLLVSNCIFEKNKKAKQGTSIYINTPYNQPGRISNTIFLQDTALHNGGAIYTKGGVVDVINSVVAQCAADSFGGAIYNTGQMRLINSTLSRNRAKYGGSGVYNTNNGTLKSINSIVWGNADGITNNNGGSANAFYSLVQGYPASSVNHNLAGTTNPLFVDTTLNNFKLKTGSPCINAGSNDSIPSFITTDLAGNARINQGTVDMGAYEWLLIAPQVALGNDTSICAGSFLTLHAGNPGSSYLWSTGATTESITVATSGSYSVSATNGAGISRDTIVITVAPLPVVNLGADTGFCPGTGVMLNAEHPGASYQWSTGATTQTITATAAGTYGVQVTDANGCIGQDTVQLTAYASPTSSLGPDKSICAGSSTTLSTTPESGYTYLWSTGATTPGITVSTGGSYTLTVTNSNGCTTSDTQVVTVHPLPTVNLGADFGICTGEAATLSAANPGATYLWNTGATTQHITVTGAGTYSVRVTNQTTQCVGSDTINITPLPLPIVNLGPDVTVPAGTTSYTLNAGNPGSIYQWNTGASSQAITVTTTGTYHVAVTNNSGCKGRDTIQVTFHSSNGVAAVGDRTLGITVAPNPADGQVFIFSDQPLVGALCASVSNALGREVMRAVVVHSGQAIDVNGLTPGIYVVRIEDAAGRYQLVKLEKK